MKLSSHIFRCSAVPDPSLQLVATTVACTHDVMDHGAMSRPASSNTERTSKLGIDSYETVNYISPEARALLVAAEESAARRADACEDVLMKLDVNGSGSTLQSALSGMLGPQRRVPNMAPPKRFYRIFWQSMSLKLLDRSEM
jgi:hypothetical protein